MKNRSKRAGNNPRTLSRYLMLGVGITWPALTAVACVHSPPEVTQQSVDVVQGRVQEVERTTGRLTVRVEELEAQMMLLQDSMEANRIALQRTGIQSRHGMYAEQEMRPLHPAPQTNYYGHERTYQEEMLAQRASKRRVENIPLSARQSGADLNPNTRPVHIQSAPVVDEVVQEDDHEEIVITEEQFRTFAGPDTVSAAQQQPSAQSAPANRPATHAPVTSERLPTSRELETQSSSSSRTPPPAPHAQESSAKRPTSPTELMKLYQDSLAEYRAGNYAKGLEGFQTFLDAGPRKDYIDNALYWIGECNYGLGHYDVSAQYFQRIIHEMPDTTKAPDAMLKLSLAYERLGRRDDAENLLKKLVKEHPTSNPGKLGAKRLEEHYQP